MSSPPDCAFMCLCFLGNHILPDEDLAAFHWSLLGPEHPLASLKVKKVLISLNKMTGVLIKCNKSELEHRYHRLCSHLVLTCISDLTSELYMQISMYWLHVLSLLDLKRIRIL